MSDRLQEIRARLDAATTLPASPNSVTLFPLDRRRDEKAERVFIAHAPGDIAWLLAENEAFREQIQFLRDDIRRVREYAHHRDGCAAIADADAIHDTPCDCGLEVEDA